MIKRIDENKKEICFNNLQEAAKSINTGLETWKVELYISNAIDRNIKAFKYNWIEVKKK